MFRRLALSLAWVISLLALTALLVWAEASKPEGAAVVPATRQTRVSGTAEVYTTGVTIPTYPYAGCLRPPQIGVAGVPYQALDWDCLSHAGPPVSQTYTLLVLSNDYLSVTLLPELGGRVYELVFKPTGHNELYRNPVIKPSPWGPPEQGWGLAVGGMEWGFPTDEHGYEWGVPWRYRVFESAAGVTVTLRDSDAFTRPTVAIAVHLPADQAALVIRPQIFNPTAANLDLKYWTNALLVPGAANAPSADLRFLFPSERVTVHSTGDAGLPPAGELMEWPIHNGRDYSQLGNWDQWLGFFEAPEAHGPFAGVYDTAADEGVVRVYPADLVKGSKGFAFGWNDALPSSLWTDDDSAFVEVHGGLAPTFWDATTLSAGEVVSWTEVWYPVAGIGGVSTANAEVALRLERLGDALGVGLYSPATREDLDLYLWGSNCTVLGHWQLLQVDPAHPVAFTLPVRGLTPEQLSLVALSADGALLGGVNPRDCLPPIATVEPLPSFVTTSTFTVAWRGDDFWSGVTTYDVQSRTGYEGQWRDWLTNTPAISDTFTGVNGETYFFRARARDAAGNAGAYAVEEWGQAFTTVLLNPAPVLVTSRKLVAPVTPALGQTVSYTLVLSNTGNLTAAGVALTDYLPVTLQLISDTLSAGEPSDGLIAWQGTLPPGRDFRLTYAMAPSSATPVGIPLTNTAWLMADGLAPLSRVAVVRYRHLCFLPLVSKNLMRAVIGAFAPSRRSVSGGGPAPAEYGPDNHGDNSQQRKEETDGQRSQNRSCYGSNQRTYEPSHARSQYRSQNHYEDHHQTTDTKGFDRALDQGANEPSDDQANNCSNCPSGHVQHVLSTVYADSTVSEVRCPTMPNSVTQYRRGGK